MRPARGSGNSTLLLTGCTGLVGSALLVRLLAQWNSVAVLVRPRGRFDARLRVEEVMRPLEQGTLLPRPKVIVADLNSTGLGVSTADRDWLSQRSVCVLHCAGSIRFEKDPQTNEPYRSNVDGTRHLLEFVSELDVASFDFVSTAYVQNQSGEVCYEKMIQSPDLASNDYERSKIMAERLVVEWGGIGPVTIHRPSIVVGDSRSSHTSTFHGFYAPLKVASQFVQSFGFDSQAGEQFRQQLGLGENDRKNLVPVDWIADGIVESLSRYAGPQTAAESETVAQTDGNLAPVFYHWTHSQPVRCRVMQDAIVDAIAAMPPSKTSGPREPVDAPQLGQFRSLLGVYESYFQNDPQFDRTVAQRDFPALKCPEVDGEMLRRLADYALRENFGWPKRPAEAVPDVNLLEILSNTPSNVASGASAVVQVIALGPGSPEPLVFGEFSGQWLCIAGGLPPDAPRVWLTASWPTLISGIRGTTGLIDLIDSGACVIQCASYDWGYDAVNRWIGDVQSRLTAPRIAP